MAKRKFDEVIPTLSVHRETRQMLQAEADRRNTGAKLPDIIREAINEYIAAHDLNAKLAAEQTAAGATK